MSKYNIRACSNYAALCAFVHISHKYPKEMFEKPMYIPFEGHDMPVPQDCDLYLRILYGDYMKLPPIEERKPRIECVCLDLNKSYLEYKGVYYPVPEEQ